MVKSMTVDVGNERSAAATAICFLVMFSVWCLVMTVGVIRERIDTEMAVDYRLCLAGYGIL